MVLALTARDIRLEVAFNVRHLGGYATASGGETPATVIRAAGLNKLTRDAVGQLRDLDVGTVVDLRSQVERERDVTPELSWAGIDVVHAPVFEQDASPAGLDREFPGFSHVYRTFLDTGRNAYRTLFEHIARTDRSVLFHCTAGKDRTGVAAALLLSLAGVAKQDILDDYSRSAELIAPLLESWKPDVQRPGMNPDRAKALMASDAPDMEVTLAFIEERWGDAKGYLLDTGVADADISALRARLG